MEVTVKTNLLNLDRSGMEGFFADLGEQPFRAAQLTRWIHQRGSADIGAMTDLGKGLRERLDAVAGISVPAIVREQVSDDGTCKWLLELDGGNCVETVFIPESGRGTLCISSQVGCKLDCAFCATGKQGFNRNLTTAEIIAQLWVANRQLGRGADGRYRITNVVMMGMGEPLLNFDNVVPALNIMTDDLAYGLAKRRVTVSTAGVVPAIDRLKQASDVSLAVSLHATNDELRDRLVPLNRKYPIAELLAACRRYVADVPRRKITFEYVMLDHVNDQPAHARELIRLLSNVPSKVNLIPFNPFPGAEFKTSSPDALRRFRDMLQQAGLITVTRKTRGDDIDAACGQLAGKVNDRTQRSRKYQLKTTGVAL
ncbi:MAG: hypothetical protein FD165_2743 [Gammaproteobacteria bacterium]|nr:MAG: hypothetical protein FD165_2743 [Gammaproteobacteria bacterium]TND00890.1 MAG: hypothetical protein FD120_2731 [Gammaproteobacteria bacterium]